MDKEKLISFEGLEKFKYNLEDSYGKPAGLAQLDDQGHVFESELPQTVFNIKEYNTMGDFPAQGQSSRLYVDLSTNSLYRWDGSAYVNTSSPDIIKYTEQT